jgi:putative oxidoreductase
MLMQHGLFQTYFYGDKICAALVALWFIPVTYFGHPFWAGIDPVNNREHFMNNLAIIAAYMTIAYFGAGNYSLDGNI